MSECNTQTCNEKQQQCPVEKSVNNKECPIECAIDTWNASFCQAMRETQVDVLKEKIKKTWGPTIDKEADAIIVAMGTYWETLLKKGKSQCELRESFKNIFAEVVS